MIQYRMNYDILRYIMFKCDYHTHTKFSFDGAHSRFTEFAEAKPKKAKAKK